MKINSQISKLLRNSKHTEYYAVQVRTVFSNYNHSYKCKPNYFQVFQLIVWGLRNSPHTMRQCNLYFRGHKTQVSVGNTNWKRSLLFRMHNTNPLDCPSRGIWRSFHCGEAEDIFNTHFQLLYMLLGIPW